MKVASRIRSGAALVVAAVLSLVVLPGSAQASARPAPVVAPVLADAPFRLPQPITDNAGALNGDSSAVQTALTKLDNTGKAHLWVVFVKSFGTTNNADWAAQTFSLSSLDPKRDALLAVAVDDHSYYLGANSAFPLSASDLDAIGNNDVRPHLSSKDWAGAAVAAANGIQTKLTSSSSSGWVIWVILLVIIGVGVWFWMRSRRRKAAPDAPADSGVPAKPLEPYEQLSERSVQALIATDNTVRTSEAQLTLAEQTFGATAVADFRTAFEQARALLADAFALRQQIDDDVPESEQQRRDWMAQILDKCAAAHKTLDDQSDRFDQLLDVKTRLPQVLSELPGQIDAQVARIPTATSTLASLTQAYVASATGTVAGNTEQAQSRLDYARHELAEAGGTDGSQAVLAARAALEAVAQATMLLGSIDKLRDDLAAAAAALPGKLAPVQAELAAARAALSEHSAGTAGTSLTQRLDQVAAALAAVAGTAGAKDPILATQRVHEADEALDQILADTRSAQENEDKLGRALTNAMSSAGSKIERVSDYLSQRRGVVGSEARTRLAEASRHLAQAQALAGTDQAQALSEAHQADAMADEALRLAQNDFTGFGGGGYGGGYGGGMFGGGRGGSNIGGAILGGIIGGILSGGGGYRGGGLGGGFGGGGGGGFGGGSSGGGGDFGGGGGRF